MPCGCLVKWTCTQKNMVPKSKNEIIKKKSTETTLVTTEARAKNRKKQKQNKKNYRAQKEATTEKSVCLGFFC